MLRLSQQKAFQHAGATDVYDGSDVIVTIGKDVVQLFLYAVVVSRRGVVASLTCQTVVRTPKWSMHRVDLNATCSSAFWDTFRHDTNLQSSRSVLSSIAPSRYTIMAHLFLCAGQKHNAGLTKSWESFFTQDEHVYARLHTFPNAYAADSAAWYWTSGTK